MSRAHGRKRRSLRGPGAFLQIIYSRPPPLRRPVLLVGRRGGVTCVGAGPTAAGRGSRDFLCIEILVIHHRAPLNHRSHNSGGDTRSRRTTTSASTGLLTHRRRRTRTSTRLLTRISGFVELNEFVLSGRHGRHRFLAFEDRIRDATRIKTDRPHGVVVTGDHVVDAVRGAVRVHDGPRPGCRASRLHESRSSRGRHR